MKRLDNFSGQIVTSEDLDHLQDSKDEAISERYNDIISDGIFRLPSVGVVGEFEITINTLDNEKFDINYGTAKVTDNGLSERIVILTTEAVTYDSTNPTKTPPRSTGNLSIPLDDNTLGENNYIYLKYLKTEDPAVQSIHWQTGVVYYPNADDGYEVIVNQDPTFDSTEDFTIFIGRILATGGDIDVDNIFYTKADLTARTYITLNAGFQEDLDPTLIQYQIDSHSNGIVSAEVIENITREELHIGYKSGATTVTEPLIDNKLLAQRFKPTTNIDLSKIELNIKTSSSLTTPLNNIKVTIYNDGGGVGTEQPGAPMSDSGINIEAISSDFRWISFNIVSGGLPIPLFSGTAYWIVIEKVSLDGIQYDFSHHVDAHSSNYPIADGDPAWLNFFESVDNGVGWTPTGTGSNDLHFKVIETKAISQIETLALTVDNVYTISDVPTLWLNQLKVNRLNLGIPESVYVEGERYDEVVGADISGDLVRVSFDSLVYSTGTKEVYVDDHGGVYVAVTAPATAFILWKIDYDSSLKAWYNFDDVRKYRLTANSNIRGIEIDYDTDNIEITNDLTVKGTSSLEDDLDLNNNNIDDIASIDGGGNAIIVDDDLDLSDNKISNMSEINNAGSPVIINDDLSVKGTLKIYDGSTERARILTNSATTGEEDALVIAVGADDIIFRTSLTAGTNERMRILSNGYVGINVKTPNTTLEIYGDFRVTYGDPSQNYYSGIQPRLVGAANVAHDLIIKNNIATFTPLTLAGPSGYVGINKLAPTSQLDVDGDISLNNHSLLNVDWSTSDDGPGSGLDADTVDGYSAEDIIMYCV